jgi:hypothetical protein
VTAEILGTETGGMQATKSVTDEDAPAQTQVSRTSPWLVLTVMCVGYFLVLLDVTTVNVALLQIGHHLGTPAVVAAAVASVEPERAGLASGINNTARQAGGAFGIAIFGAIAGSAANAGAFASGMRVAGVIAAGLFAFTAAAVGRVRWRTDRADL